MNVSTPAMHSDAHNSGELPVTEILAEQIITLPISAKMTLGDVDYVLSHIEDLFVQ